MSTPLSGSLPTVRRVVERVPVTFPPLLFTQRPKKCGYKVRTAPYQLVLVDHSSAQSVWKGTSFTVRSYTTPNGYLRCYFWHYVLESLHFTKWVPGWWSFTVVNLPHRAMGGTTKETKERRQNRLGLGKEWDYEGPGPVWREVKEVVLSLLSEKIRVQRRE